MTNNTRETVDSYVTDMLALEKHIQTALAGQIEDLDANSEFKRTLVHLHDGCAIRVQSLESLTSRREQNLGGVSQVMKKAVASVLGLGAAAVDFVRTEKLPKDLRDDYTAISLAYIGYLMLHTTALTFHDAEVADLAKAHLAQHAASMKELQRIIPEATMEFLVSEGMPVDQTVAAAVHETVKESWT